MSNAANVPAEVLKAFESVPDLYLILSTDFHILTASDAYLQATFTNRENIVGNYLFDVFPNNPEVAEANAVSNLHASLQQVIATKKQHRMEVQHYDVPKPAKKGIGFIKKYWLPLNTPVLNEQGEIHYLIHKVEDITALMTSTNQLKYLEESIDYSLEKNNVCDTEWDRELTPRLFNFLEMYRMVVEHSPDMITRWDKTQKLVFANAAFIAHMRKQNARFLGTGPAGNGKTGLRAEPLMQLLHQVFTEGRTAEHLSFNASEEGNQYFYTRLVPEFGSSGEVEYVLAIDRDVTELKQTEAELNNHKELLQAVFDSSRFGIGVLDPVLNVLGDMVDLRFCLVNPELERMTRDGLKGQDLSTLYPQSVGKLVLDAFQQVYDSGIPLDFEQDIDGLWFRYVIVKLESRLVYTVEDITARKTAELALQDAHTRIESSHTTIRRMLGGGFVGICLLDARRDVQGNIDGFIVRGVNQTFEEFCQKKEVDLLGLALEDVLPGYKDWFFHEYIKVVETGEEYRNEYYCGNKNLCHWFDVSAIRNGDGLILTLQDITKRKKAEKDLQNNYQFLLQAEEVAEMGCWEYEPASEKLYWSAGMYRLFEMEVGSPVYPETYLQHVVEEDLAEVISFVQSLHQPSEVPRELIHRIRVSDKIMCLKVRTFEVHEASHGAKVLGVVLDVSELKRLEEENLKISLMQQKQLLRAILEAQGEERRRIAESLHNGVGQILFATKLNLHKALKQLKQKEDPSQALKTAQEMLTQAISATRQASHELVPVLLQEFGIQMAFEDLCSKYSESSLQLRCVVEGISTRLDPYLEVALLRISQELINNVAKHAQATTAELSLQKIDTYVLLQVRDNGKGFSQNKDQPKGLGLKIVKDKVHLLNGTFVLNNNEEGTLVAIKIPVEAS